jgi:hypothetical protein
MKPSSLLAVCKPDYSHTCPSRNLCLPWAFPFPIGSQIKNVARPTNGRPVNRSFRS